MLNLMIFSINDFLGDYSDYQADQLKAWEDEESPSKLDSFMALVCDTIPRGLDQMEFLKYYMEDQGFGEEAYQAYRAVFKDVPPSKLLHSLGRGLGLHLIGDLEFLDNNQIDLRLSHEDDISFLARRLFDGEKKRVLHREMKVTDQNGDAFYSRLGSKFLMNALSLYDAIGINHIVIPAPQGIGLRAWLKTGFRIRKNAWEEGLNGFMVEVADQMLAEPEKVERLKELFYTKSALVMNWLANQDNAIADEFFTILSHAGPRGAAPDLRGGYYANLKSARARQRFEDYCTARGLEKPHWSRKLEANANDQKQRARRKHVQKVRPS